MTARTAPLTDAAWRALGTSVHLLVTDPAHLDPARVAVDETLRLVDATYSRFRDSELTRLNARPGERVRVSPLFATAIDLSLQAARATGGVVDPTVGRALRLLGYDADFDVIARGRAPLTVRVAPVPGWRAVDFDPGARVVRLPDGVELDLGSTGKALAADLAVSAALAATGGGILVSLGGDLASAGSPPPGGWRILVAEDSDVPPDSPGEVVSISAGALATSSTTVRRWSRGGVRLHHLIDPRSGLPAHGPWRTVSVAAATCVEANMASTAAIVLGSSALDWLRERALPARLVDDRGHVVRAAGWPGAGEAAA